MADDELSAEERELVAKHRAERKAAEDEQEHEYEIGKGDAYARVSSKSKAGKKVNTFFKREFGIDLDDEPVQDDEPDEGGGKGKAKPGRQQAQGGTVKAFGRRVS